MVIFGSKHTVKGLEPRAFPWQHHDMYNLVPFLENNTGVKLQSCS